MAKSMIKLSMTLKNKLVLPKYLNTAKVLYSGNKLQEAYKNTKIKVSTPKELYGLLQNESHPSILVSSIAVNKSLVNGKHIVIALTAMHKYYKDNMIQPSDIMKSEHFQKICSILNNHLLTLGTPQMLQALKILNLVGVPSSSSIMQSILQLLRNSLNDLHLHEIFFISFLLKKLEPTHLSNALLIALPHLFEAQCQMQLDVDDLKELSNSLRFASENTKNIKILNYIIDAIDNFPRPIDVDSALQILWSLAVLENLPDNYLRVLENAKEVIAENVNIIKSFEASKTIALIAEAESNGIQGFYCADIVDKLIGRLFYNNDDFNKTIMALRNINKLNHINFKLLDYLTFLCCQNPNILSDCNILCLITLSAGFSFADYKPKNWTIVEKLLINNYKRLLLDYDNFTHVAVDLASIGSFDSNILSTAFNFEFYSKSIHGHDHKLKRLYYYAKHLYPEYTGPWPAEKLLETFENASITGYSKPLNYPLLPALKYILKDPSYIISNLMTQEGIFIDHLILLQDKSPVKFDFANCNDFISTINVEDLKIPPELTRVAIILLPREVYGRNIKRLRASVSTNIKLLEALSYHVVAISEELWNEMPENELVPYLNNSLPIENKKSIGAVENR